jgi:hypothetical protein
MSTESGGLRARAKAAATPPEPVITGPDLNGGQPLDDDLPVIEYTDPIEDVEQVPVHIAWQRVMRDVRTVPKSQVAKIQTDKGSYSFQYRGIDQVLNAVGPAIRRHGIQITPIKVETTYNTIGRVRECTVIVTYEIEGPMGDKKTPVQGAGEALDTGERATVKAQTGAYRAMLIAALCLPTYDPKLDPDRVNIERPEQPMRPVGEYVEEILDSRTSVGRLNTMKNELSTDRANGSRVGINEHGDEERLVDMVYRVAKARRAAGE